MYASRKAVYTSTANRPNQGILRAARGRLLAGILLFCTAACDRSLPAAPTAEQEQAFGLVGLIAYQHVNFGGKSAVITKDIGDLRDYDGPCPGDPSFLDSSPFNSVIYSWNDCVSSVRIAPGWQATLYRDDDYRDDSVEVTADIPDLRRVPHDCPAGGLNDCVTSIRVTPPPR